MQAIFVAMRVTDLVISRRIAGQRKGMELTMEMEAGVMVIRTAQVVLEETTQISLIVITDRTITEVTHKVDQTGETQTSVDEGVAVVEENIMRTLLNNS